MSIFGLHMVVKRGLEKIVLKFHVPLQSCCCPVQKCLPRKAKLAWLFSRYLKGQVEFQNNFSTPLFTTFLKQKMVISRLTIFVTYSSHSRWCVLQQFYGLGSGHGKKAFPYVWRGTRFARLDSKCNFYHQVVWNKLSNLKRNLHKIRSLSCVTGVILLRLYLGRFKS